jgi:hypothetical protein
MADCLTLIDDGRPARVLVQRPHPHPHALARCLAGSRLTRTLESPCRGAAAQLRLSFS